MKLPAIAVLTAGLTLAPALCAQNSSSLPDAPSSTPLPSAPSSSQRNEAPPAPAKQQPATPAPAAAPAAAPGVIPAATQESTAPKASSAAETSQTSQPAPQTRADATPPLPPDNGDEPLITITRQVDVVSVVFTVTDKHGNFVKDLAQKDVAVRDNNLPPKQVLAFSRETNLPLRVGLLIDASNSIRDRFKFEQESASEFLAQVIRHKTDQAFVIGFDTVAEVTTDFTNDSEKLDKGIRSLRPGGGTALYDALYFACRDKLLKAPQNGAVRRAIVLISDGADNQSRVTREEAIEMAQRAEVIVYTISTNVNGYREEGDKVLQRIAEQTGGRAFFPFKAEDVANAFIAIQDELRSQYAIAYKPAELEQNGRYHTIEIAAENRKGLKVRARKGYYAPKQ